MSRIPIALFIDDGAPRVSVYWHHAKSRVTSKGDPLVSEIPNDFLYEFYNVVDKYGIKGKLSIVPMPIGRNMSNVADGIEGFDPKEIKEWLDFVKEKVSKNFSFSPEMLTHHDALNVETGVFLDERENVWANHQSRETLVPYISYALDILKRAGFDDINGVSSPWNFGMETEDEYVSALSDALYNVYGKTDVWYALHSHYGDLSAWPKVMLDKGDRRVVRFSCTVGDTYSNPDNILTEDGRGGALREVLDAGGCPVLLTHWQSLFSNGSRNGLHTLSEVARRIEKNFGDALEWVTADDLMRRTLAIELESTK